MCRRPLTAAITLLVVAVLVRAQPPPPPTVALLNGRVFTGVASRPWAEAIAVRGERLTAVGTSQAIRALAGPETKVIDAAGRLVVPGFNDAHVHVGVSRITASLEGPPASEHDPTLDEILARLRTAVSDLPPGSWVGGEIGAAVLDDPKATRYALDEVAPDHPVVLSNWTGHGKLLNTAALRRLGVGDEEPDPPGGAYLRMPGSRTVSGVVQEYADYALSRKLAVETTASTRVEAFRRFGREAAALGITSVQLMMNALPTSDGMSALAAADLPQRVRVIDFPLTAMSEWREPAFRTTKGLTRVIVSGTKWILDGTPIERLMFLREPYADHADTRGRLNVTAEDLVEFLRRAMTAREQPLLHAAGDAAIDAVLDALERTGAERWQSLRPRLEHGDMLEPSQFARARQFGVVLVQNPSHFMLRPLAEARLGPRLERSWLLKQAIASRIPVAIGSDGPLSPFLNLMFASINANNPTEALTREQAVTAYTSGAAFAEMKEKEKGTIAPGMLADLVVLSQDIFTVPVEALPTTSSVMTMIGGRVVYERQ
jgi:predicted amidohydrolase YtcJ